MGCLASKPDATAAVPAGAGSPRAPDADTKDTRAAAAKNAFATVDKSGDGKVSMPEAKKALEAAFPKLGKYVAKAFLASDDDGSFYLDREEYEAVHTCLASFAAVDTSADGKVSAMEAKAALAAEFAAVTIPTTFFLTSDADGDFYLSLPELVGLRQSVATYADADKSGGKVSMPEAKKMLVARFPRRANTVAEFFLAADETKDFYLSLVEFSSLMRTFASFTKADRSGDGKVSLPEAKKAVANDFGEGPLKKLTALFMEYDGKGGDFYLQPKEYYARIRRLRRRGLRNRDIALVLLARPGGGHGRGGGECALARPLAKRRVSPPNKEKVGGRVTD